MQNLIVGFKMSLHFSADGLTELPNKGISARLCFHSERNLKVTSVEFESEVSGFNCRKRSKEDALVP